MILSKSESVTLLKRKGNLSGETERERQGAKLRRTQRVSRSLCTSALTQRYFHGCFLSRGASDEES